MKFSLVGSFRTSARPAVWFLLLAGDIEVNPGPKNWKYPCRVCSAPVKSNQQGVQCDICDIWLHTRCISVSNDEYEKLQSSVEPWCCHRCCLKEALPFSNVSSSDSLFNNSSANQSDDADSIVNTSQIIHTSLLDGQDAEYATQPANSPSPLLECRSSLSSKCLKLTKQVR